MVQLPKCHLLLSLWCRVLKADEAALVPGDRQTLTCGSVHVHSAFCPIAGRRKLMRRHWGRTTHCC